MILKVFFIDFNGKPFGTSECVHSGAFRPVFAIFAVSPLNNIATLKWNRYCKVFIYLRWSCGKTS